MERKKRTNPRSKLKALSKMIELSNHSKFMQIKFTCKHLEISLCVPLCVFLSKLYSVLEQHRNKIVGKIPDGNIHQWKGSLHYSINIRQNIL